MALRDDMVLYLFCQHYRLESDELEATQLEQLLYIHRKLVEWTGEKDPLRLLNWLKLCEDELRIKKRSRRRLYNLYEWVKHTNMVHSQRYNTSTLRPPLTQIDKLTVLTRKSSYR